MNPSWWENTRLTDSQQFLRHTLAVMLLLFTSSVFLTRNKVLNPKDVLNWFRHCRCSYWRNTHLQSSSASSSWRNSSVSMEGMWSQSGEMSCFQNFIADYILKIMCLSPKISLELDKLTSLSLKEEEVRHSNNVLCNYFLLQCKRL